VVLNLSPATGLLFATFRPFKIGKFMSVTARKAEVKVRKFYFGMQMSALAYFTDGELEETNVCFLPFLT